MELYMENFLTISQVAKRVGVNPQTIRRWDRAGKFVSSRHPINNYRVYKYDQVEKLLEELNQGKLDKHETGEPKIETTPWFQTDLGQLYNLDVLDFFKMLPSQAVHLIFADPPYNIKKAEWDTFESQKKYIEWTIRWIKEAERVLHPTGSLFICGFSEILADIKWAASSYFKGCKWLVWYYRNKANLGNDWGRSHESLLHFRKSRKFIFNMDEVRIPYNAHTLRYPTRPQAQSSQYTRGNKQKEYLWTPNPAGAKPKDVFELPTLSNHSWEKTIHPTQKPVELVKKIILGSSNQESLIVDPFGGSGTTYAIAEAYNRRWAGTEINAEYCEIIKARLSDEDQIERINRGKDEEESLKRRQKLRGIVPNPA
jgi:site-specific DNA-methyltransferase (adenine-specific)